MRGNSKVCRTKSSGANLRVLLGATVPIGPGPAHRPRLPRMDVAASDCPSAADIGAPGGFPRSPFAVSSNALPNCRAEPPAGQCPAGGAVAL